jgi:Coenzyme PQQ synthesis protein D (PqqD)
VGDDTLSVRDSGVIHERLDDEVIVIDLEHGMHYALVGTAANIWTSFTGGATVDAVAATLAPVYGASLDEVRADVSGFASQLEAAGLLVTSPTVQRDTARVAVHEPPAHWEEPVLEANSDMANLVISDPARVVDEAGWPHLPYPEP